MNEDYNKNKAETLKTNIKENVAVNDSVVCGFCDTLISLGKETQDWQSVAFGYVWRADYFCYVESDLKEASKELYFAKTYIDEETPSELLEKFYTLKHVLFEQSYDVQSAFQYSLKALEVAEQLDIKYRVGANYGNIATYYMDYGCYEEAMLHSTRALEVFRALQEKHPRIIRILLCNIIKVYLKLGRMELAKQAIEELQALPIEKKDLQIYVDYAYMMYYAAARTSKKSSSYLSAMFKDGITELPNRTYVIELLTDGLEAMIELSKKEEAERLLSFLLDYIKEEETEPLLKVCGLKILYSASFQTEEQCRPCYEDYYQLYIKVQDKTNSLKADGLRAGVELNEMAIQCERSRREIDELYDLANYDGLTQIYNRHYFNVRLDEMLNSKKHMYIGLAMIDVDYFKEYNDYYGHAAGDEVLKQVALCLKENIGESMIAARYGGDEFICMSWGDNCDKIAGYVEAAAEMLRTKKIEHTQSRCADQITLSIGFGCKSVLNRVEVVALFDEVDGALYEAKRSGRNCIKSIAVSEE